mmetsp:Transcript_28655/g.66059  ORF Transcript_28655/g.66059 Transcript_28655/m.66059 type:complete len:210 (-) Transcript_28655:462-1091(-)
MPDFQPTFMKRKHGNALVYCAVAASKTKRAKGGVSEAKQYLTCPDGQGTPAPTGVVMPCWDAVESKLCWNCRGIISPSIALASSGPTASPDSPLASRLTSSMVSTISFSLATSAVKKEFNPLSTSAASNSSWVCPSVTSLRTACRTRFASPVASFFFVAFTKVPPALAVDSTALAMRAIRSFSGASTITSRCAPLLFPASDASKALFAE